MFKHIGGVTLFTADALFGSELPVVVRNLHHESSVHLYAAIVVYLVLAVLTAWVIACAVRGKPQAANRAAMPRAIRWLRS